MEKYISEFPFSEYEISTVPSYGYTGCYYVDFIDDCIKSWLRAGNAWESHIALLITQHARRGSKVLDIGAHIGTHTQTMANVVGPEGEVLAFEPQPKIFRELVQNLKLNNLENVTCYWAALGSETSQIEIPTLTPWNEGGTNLVEGDLASDGWSYKIRGGTGVSVDLIPIDSLNLNDVSLIKLDVEHMENAALDGARETILRNKPVIILEIMGGYTPEYTPQGIDQIEFTKKKVADMGYTVYRFDAWDYLAIPN